MGLNTMKRGRVVVSGCKKKVWFGIEENLTLDSSAACLILLCREGGANHRTAKYVRRTVCIPLAQRPANHPRITRIRIIRTPK